MNGISCWMVMAVGQAYLEAFHRGRGIKENALALYILSVGLLDYR